jgi:uncharacterized membrane protein YphA (DoxX/SURF4 family)
MKQSLQISRIIIGLVFIFSGLIKANDPMGLSFKMQEFFEAWGMAQFNFLSLPLAFLMNLFEVTIGVAMLIGWRMPLFTTLLFVFMLFFTFLTAYALFSGKIKSCGCFGDCIRLTPTQSFTKDIILLLLSTFLFFNRKRFNSKPQQPRTADMVLSISVVFVIFFQLYVLKYLPLKDCLPYKAGNNILEQMKLPANAIADSFSIVFQYKKNNKIIEFDATHFPEDFDSTYQFIKRYDKLVRKGNATPAITDFALQTIHGSDTTQAVLSHPNTYVLLWAQNMDYNKKKEEKVQAILHFFSSHSIPVFIITAQAEAVPNKWSVQFPILQCDATVMKTAARVNPTVFIMQGATIKEKYSYASEQKIKKFLEENY